MRNLRDLNLNSLRAVESAARTGSFVRAAEEQLLTPSAISQRIKNLEAQLRFKIFNRRNNSVVLTTEGDVFVAHVREALDTILSAGLEARSIDRESTLKICALPTFTVRWLLPRLTGFEEAFPNTRLNLSNSYTAPNFAKEDFDLDIRYGNGDFPGLESELLFQEELTPVCAPSLISDKYPKGLSGLRPGDLQHTTLLHSATCTMNWQYWLEQNNAHDVLKNAASTYFDSCMLSYEAANNGMGFAIVNCAYMMDEIATHKLIAPFRSSIKSGFGWYVVYPKSHGMLDRVTDFKNWIIEEAKASQTQCLTIFEEHYDMALRQ